MLKEITLGSVLLLASASAAMAQGRHGPRAMFGRADANGDSSVSRDEFRAAREEQFGKRDRNSDGYIDAADLPSHAASRPRTNVAVDRMHKQFDTDGDGKISKQEFVDGAMPLFDQADTDGNGVLDTKERENARSAMRSRASGSR